MKESEAQNGLLEKEEETQKKTKIEKGKEK